MIKRDENGTIIEIVMDENGDISEEEESMIKKIAEDADMDAESKVKEAKSKAKSKSKKK